MTLKDRWRAWRNRLLMSARFQRWAAALPITRTIARREATALFDVVAGFVYTQVLLGCVRLGVLERLRAGPCDEVELIDALRASDAAQRLTQDLSDAALRTLLQAAASLDLIESQDDSGTGDHASTSASASRRWTLGTRGATLLGLPGVLAMIEHHAVLYRDLADPLAMLAAPRGETALARYWPYASAVTPADLGAPSTTAYTELMAASQGLVAEEILDAYDVRVHRLVLDVGGGSGRFLAALATRAPSARLMLFDLPGVVVQAQANFRAWGLEGRTTVVAGDFGRDALPSGADLLTFVRVLHDHDDGLVQHLLAAAYAALPPGGTVLVAEPMADTAGARRMGAAYFGVYLWAMGSGRPRSATELQALLRGAGFTALREHPTRIPLQTRVWTARRL